jgi:hypothetical protein
MTRLFITYMEQLAPPFGEPLQAPETSVNVQQESLGIDDYLDLYRAVRSTHWQAFSPAPLPLSTSSDKTAILSGYVNLSSFSQAK